nr:hypothetical protein JVH1_8705 [Rhodococcus sp. JVH1]
MVDMFYDRFGATSQLVRRVRTHFGSVPRRWSPKEMIHGHRHVGW